MHAVTVAFLHLHSSRLLTAHAHERLAEVWLQQRAIAAKVWLGHRWNYLWGIKSWELPCVVLCCCFGDRIEHRHNRCSDLLLLAILVSHLIFNRLLLAIHTLQILVSGIFRPFRFSDSAVIELVSQWTAVDPRWFPSSSLSAWWSINFGVFGLQVFRGENCTSLNYGLLQGRVEFPQTRWGHLIAIESCFVY